MDLDAVLQAYPALVPKRELATVSLNNNNTSSSTPSSGASQQFQINLRGTIPVNYKGNVYNIPVVVCVPVQYPNQYPSAYVVPTPQMLIRPSQHVDTNGKFYHPYISNWLSVTARNGAPTSTLVDLIRHMQTIFSQECPVYNRPPSSSSSGNFSTQASNVSSRQNSGNSPYAVTLAPGIVSPPPLSQTLPVSKDFFEMHTLSPM